MIRSDGKPTSRAAASANFVKFGFATRSPPRAESVRDPASRGRVGRTRPNRLTAAPT